MSRRPSTLRLATLACGIALTAAACNTIPTGTVSVPSGRVFIPTVPDSVDDVGLGEAVTVDDQGLPYLSYLGFPGTLEAGEIPISRPVGAPFLTTEDGKDASAVLLAHLTPDQIWDKGAVAEPRDAPGGFEIPFGPAPLPSLESMTPHNATGTDIALAGTDVHVVWGSDTGVWYGVGPDFEVETVEETHSAGSPSIAVDGSGTPVVAYVVAGVQPEVRVAELVGKKWQRTTVATLSACGIGCPEAADVAIVGGEPLVVVPDVKTGELVAVQRQGSAWKSEVVAKGTTGGASIASSGDAATITFYTDAGVSLATGTFGNWTTQDVAAIGPAPETPSPTPSAGGTKVSGPAIAPTTGLAVDGQGTTWVAWQDATSIHLASSESDGEFKEVQLAETEGGVTPAVAATEDGSTVYLAWYDAADADLRLGFYGEAQDLLVAAVSPTPAVVTAAPTTCGENKKPVLTVVAQNITFDPTCLVATAGKPFTITFDNQDDGITHNVVIATDEASIGNPIAKTPDVTGVDQASADVSPLDQGNYFFVCTFHPTQMSGTLAVVAAGK